MRIFNLSKDRNWCVMSFQVMITQTFYNILLVGRVMKPFVDHFIQRGKKAGFLIVIYAL